VNCIDVHHLESKDTRHQSKVKHKYTQLYFESIIIIEQPIAYSQRDIFNQRKW